jgi:hypothetical protein
MFDGSDGLNKKVSVRLSIEHASTLPPMHDAAFAWNAGFIRQVCNRRVLLPDESGVPVVMSRCALDHPASDYGE